ncbi:MAG: alpha/beta fold hydrolase BchO [Pseudomonadota bacterium]
MQINAIPDHWPHAAQMRRVQSRPHDWSVIEAGVEPGRGPTILMLHGAGGSGHSFRALIPWLAPQYHLVIPDLPGQGFTRAGNKGRLGLDPMAEDLARLCETMAIRPRIILGHSAGAAIALRMSETLPVGGVIGLNAALGAFEGAAGVLFPLLARVLAITPFIPTFVSRLWGNPATVKKLITSTGSAPDAEGLACYLALVQDRDHIDGTLAMMAQWRLDGLLARLPDLQTPTLLIATAGDKAVPARISREAAARMPDATYLEMEKLGHLAHEEAAERIAGPMLDWLTGRLAASA